MGQSLLPCFQGISVWTDGPESLSKVPPRDWHWSTDGSAQKKNTHEKKSQNNKTEYGCDDDDDDNDEW